MTGYIYMVTCSETNKVYIGQVTHEYHRRFNRHIRTAFKTKKRIKDCKFYRAFRKYGKDSFSVECLEKKPFQNLVECVKWLDERENIGFLFTIPIRMVIIQLRVVEVGMSLLKKFCIKWAQEIEARNNLRKK